MLAATRKSETKLRKTEKNMEKENNTDESDFSENEIPDLILWSLLNLNQKQTEILTVSIDDKEQDTEYKAQWIGNIEWCECGKQCKPMKTYTKSLCCEGRNNIPERCF